VAEYITGVGYESGPEYITGDGAHSVAEYIPDELDEEADSLGAYAEPLADLIESMDHESQDADVDTDIEADAGMLREASVDDQIMALGAQS